MNKYLPEGTNAPQGGYTPEELRRAQQEHTILEAPAYLCDENHDLHVELGCCRGLIPRAETAIGIADGSARDIAILSKVGQPVCFHVQELLPDGSALLSRRSAQEQALSHLLRCQTGDVLPAVVTNLAPFGAFCDIGCGNVALLGIENISISRIAHASERFTQGQQIFVAIRSIDPTARRISLTHKELLGTWAENAAMFRQGQTVTGIVRSVKDYGVFVELTPNLSGLAENTGELRPGDAISVYIKSILPEKLKFKLVTIQKLDTVPCRPLAYFITSGRISSWQYGNNQLSKVLSIF